MLCVFAPACRRRLPFDLPLISIVGNNTVCGLIWVLPESKETGVGTGRRNLRTSSFPRVQNAHVRRVV